MIDIGIVVVLNIVIVIINIVIIIVFMSLV